MAEGKPLVSYTVDAGTKPGEYVLVDVTMDRMINGYQGGLLSIKLTDPKTMVSDAAIRKVVVDKLARETGLAYQPEELKDLTPGAKVIMSKADDPKKEEPKKDTAKKSER